MDRLPDPECLLEIDPSIRLLLSAGFHQYQEWHPQVPDFLAEDPISD